MVGRKRRRRCSLDSLINDEAVFGFYFPAEKDMLDVYRYMADVLSVPETGLLYLEKFQDAVDGLQVFPGRFKKVFTINGREIRFCPVENYLIFYSISEKRERVEVIRILYSRRDYEALFRRLADE